jgi:hypothetical protein
MYTRLNKQFQALVSFCIRCQLHSQIHPKVSFRVFDVVQFLNDDLSFILHIFFYYYLVCKAIGTAATPGLLRQPKVIVKMIVKKQIECRLAVETEVLGENLPQRHSSGD